MFIVLMLMFNDPCDGDRRKREQLSRFADKNEIESFMIEIDTITERVRVEFDFVVSEKKTHTQHKKKKNTHTQTNKHRYIN